jgi:hypothetical protein
MNVIVRTDEEIERLEQWAMEGMSYGTHYSGMSYEEGIKETLDYLFGRRNFSPADEE